MIAESAHGRNYVALCLLAGLVGTCVAQSAPKAVYGDDDRVDQSGEALQAAFKLAGAHTVALFEKTALSYDVATNEFKVNSWGLTTLGEDKALCDGQPFASQIHPAECSGTVVSWNATTRSGLVATAGHCFDTDSDTDGCQLDTVCSMYFVFDFVDSTSPSGVIPASKVFDCAAVTHCDVRLGMGMTYDYAVAEISAEFQGSPERCSYEDDDDCDVKIINPNASDSYLCPDGTDLADCGKDAAYDTADRQTARMTWNNGQSAAPPSRATLDSGSSPRTITAAAKFIGNLPSDANLLLIGHPDGLPRKYAGAGTVLYTTTPGEDCIAGVQPPQVCAWEDDGECAP
jgi:hypothetical protein